LALWLFLAAAEAWTPLHAWLHGGAIPLDDDCPVAMIHQGKIDTAVVAVLVVVSIGLVRPAQSALTSQFVTSLTLPDVRGPPANRPAIAPA
jgi:hypothetical protein